MTWNNLSIYHDEGVDQYSEWGVTPVILLTTLYVHMYSVNFCKNSLNVALNVCVYHSPSSLGY